MRAQTSYGEIAAQLPKAPPETGEQMEAIMQDFEDIVMPGITHWQHPRFFAYFNSNAAAPSMLAELLVTTIAAQCMLWQTSPAASEVEGVMIDWLRQAMGLEDGYTGVIQDSASSATLSAVLTMRERALEYTGNQDGLNSKGNLRIYCSEQVHSSIDRACWVAGIGQANLVKIAGTGARYSMDVDALQAEIDADRAAGHTPAGIIAITGGTGIGACDDLGAVLRVAQAEDLYTHLDAAWAGVNTYSVRVSDEYGSYAQDFTNIFVWNQITAFATSPTTLVDMQYDLTYDGANAFTINLDDTDSEYTQDLTNFGYAGEYTSVAILDYSPSTTYMAAKPNMMFAKNAPKRTTFVNCQIAKCGTDSL